MFGIIAVEAANVLKAASPYSKVAISDLTTGVVTEIEGRKTP